VKYIGAHVSTEGGVQKAPINAYNIGAKAFALFVKNQRRWEESPLKDETIKAFKDNIEKYGYSTERILPHDGYLINLGHPEKEKREISLRSFIHEAKRCEALSLKYLNFHPGSHLNQISEEECIDNIINSLNHALKETDYIKLVIENTAGQGSNIGYKFEHIKNIIEGINDKNRIGVCLDTCHLYASGYDITKKESYEETIKEFDKTVGLKYLIAFHINDSKKGLGSKIDRHENLGKGTMGLDVFKYIINDRRFEEKIFILETIDESLWKDEIALLYSFYEELNL